MTRKLLKDDPTKSSTVPRAASLIVALTQVALEIAADRFAHDSMNGTSLEMESYRRWLFSTERRPARQRDYLITHPFTSHVVVAVSGGFYLLSVIEHGRVRSADAIAGGLAAIVEEAARNPTPAEEQLGQFTAIPREDWAVARGLIEAEPACREALARISDALFLVALDLHSEPASREEAMELGRSGNLHNRWFDKCLQLVVFKNGKALLNMEHTGIDGAAMIRTCSEAYSRAAKIAVVEVAPAVPAHRLRFYVPARVAATLAMHAAYLDRERACRAIAFVDGFGIRKQRWTARPLSSDVVVQLAIQRATLRTLGELPGINTTLQMRHFRHGRVEAFLSVTEASRNFLRGSHEGEDGISRLRAAAQAHRDLIDKCRRGEGVYSAFHALLAAQPPGGYARLDGDGLRLAGVALIRDRGYHLLMNNRVITTNIGTSDGLEAANGADGWQDAFEVPCVFKSDRVTTCIKAGGAVRSELHKFKSELEESLEFVAKIADQCG
jgi:carnitine O-acetyltransferase